MAVYLLVYFLGLVAGLAAKAVLDIRLRRPGLGKSIALLGLVVLVAAAFWVSGLPHPEWLLLFWAGIGLLAGLGSGDQGTAL